MSVKKQFLKSKPVCKVTFTVPKQVVAQAKMVKVVGEFNNWDAKKGVKMKPMKNGSFRAVVELKTGQDYEFRYLIDNKVWENDWNADKYVPTEFGNENSVVSCMN